MFREAYETAAKFTRPVVQFSLTGEGKCSAGVATFIVVNDEGWIVTAAHVIEGARSLAQSDAAARQHEILVAAIHADATLSSKERNKKLIALGKPNKKAVRRGATLWMGFPGPITDVAILPEADLAVGRLSNFDNAAISKYPTFKDPKSDFRHGASLCKLGFPFMDLTPTYDEAANNFSLPSGQGAMVFFPLEGMFTRILNIEVPGGTAYPFPLMFVETSSPGLMGQSGGPTFDKDGAVWAIQSRTMHLPLGFSPEIKHGGTTQKEHQFLNVGLGVHVETVLGFLKEKSIKYSVG